MTDKTNHGRSVVFARMTERGGFGRGLVLWEAREFGGFNNSISSFQAFIRLKRFFSVSQGYQAFAGVLFCGGVGVG